jgi:transposase-like protein
VFVSVVVVLRAFPEEFRRDVVKVARNSKEPRNKIAADFGVSPATLSNWLPMQILRTAVVTG